jgi:hypothetical protein
MKSTTVRFADPVYAQLEQASAMTGLPMNSIVTVACLEWMHEHVFPVLPTAMPAYGVGVGLVRRSMAQRLPRGEAFLRSLARVVPEPLGGTDPMSGFTTAAQESLARAHAIAEEARQPWIGTNHLLAGLYEVDDGRAGQALRRLNLDVPAVLRELQPEEPARSAELRLPTSRVRRVLELAQEEARSGGAQQVGTDHILLALLIDGESWTASALEGAGITLEVMRQTLGDIGPET